MGQNEVLLWMGEQPSAPVLRDRHLDYVMDSAINYYRKEEPKLTYKAGELFLDNGAFTANMKNLEIDTEKIIDIQERLHPSKNAKYVLTSYGMLYTIKSNNFSSKDFLRIAKNNKELFPLIFGKIDYLSKHKVRISFLNMIAKGDLLELESIIDAPIPYNEILTFIVSKHSGITDPDSFSSFVQLWSFTYLMWKVFQMDDNLKKWLQLIRNDEDIQSEYYVLYREAVNDYEIRHRNLTKVFESL